MCITWKTTPTRSVKLINVTSVFTVARLAESTSLQSGLVERFVVYQAEPHNPRWAGAFYSFSLPWLELTSRSAHTHTHMVPTSGASAALNRGVRNARASQVRNLPNERWASCSFDDLWMKRVRLILFSGLAPGGGFLLVFSFFSRSLGRHKS